MFNNSQEIFEKYYWRRTELALSDIKTYYKIAEITPVWYWRKDRLINGKSRESWKKPEYMPKKIAHNKGGTLNQ